MSHIWADTQDLPQLIKILILKVRKKAIHLIKVKVLKDYRAMDSVKIIIQSLLTSAGDLTRPQQKFLVSLFSTLLISCGRANFAPLGRYSQLSERTYRRQYQRSFNFMKFNQNALERVASEAVGATTLLN